MTTKKTAAKKKATSKNSEPISILKTVITIAPDGVITIAKTEQTVTEQVMSKGAAS